MNAVFSTAYLPPVEYLICLSQCDCAIVEKKENFIKQTYRNRALILSPNGVLPLSIPVKKNGLHNCPIDRLEIDYSQSWQRVHWRALETAYNASPYFLYYKDDFLPFYKQKDIRYLFDFNWQLLQLLLKLFKIQANIQTTEVYIAEYETEYDFRNTISPKQNLKSDYPFRQIMPYRQVFSDRMEFQANLSCIDLLFNEATEAKNYLKLTIR